MLKGGKDIFALVAKEKNSDRDSSKQSSLTSARKRHLQGKHSEKWNQKLFKRNLQCVTAVS